VCEILLVGEELLTNVLRLRGINNIHFKHLIVPVDFVLLVQKLEIALEVTPLTVKERLVIGSFHIEANREAVADGSAGCYEQLSDVDQELVVVLFGMRICLHTQLDPTLLFFKVLLSKLNSSLVLKVSRRVEFKTFHFSLGIV